MKLKLMLAAALLCTLLPPLLTAHALNNGLGLAPPMGWNSWNHFHCNLNESLVKATATAMVKLGLADVGYHYINLDDCWALERDNNSRVVPDPQTFPSGMFALGEYIHSLGLGFGIYSDTGNETCAGRPGSLHHEAIDAITYAAWGVDYLKYDNCASVATPERSYPIMRDALNWTGRPIFYSMCEGGLDDPAKWAAGVGNSWRTTDDISCSWGSMLNNLVQNDAWAKYGGPGHWNDPDMLEVGNGCLTHDEEVSHFSLWALIKAPLIIGADLTSIAAGSLGVLSNTEVIAVNQDPLGVQGTILTAANGGEVWGGPLANGTWAAVLINSNDDLTITVMAPWEAFGWTPKRQMRARDLWQHQDVGVFTVSYSATLAPHASVMITLSPV